MKSPAILIKKQLTLFKQILKKNIVFFLKKTSKIGFINNLVKNHLNNRPKLKLKIKRIMIKIGILSDLHMQFVFSEYNNAQNKEIKLVMEEYGEDIARIFSVLNQRK